MAVDNGVLPREIKAALQTRSFGKRVYYLPEVDSTNRLAAELARQGEAEGTLVITDFQTMGRGRGRRRWLSPPGQNLLFSLILRPGGPSKAVLPITLTFAVGIADALGSFLPGPPQVKWPNDVLVAGRKICGILAESASRKGDILHVVIGIGLNVNTPVDAFPPRIRRIATSCAALTGTVMQRGNLLARILAALESRYATFVAEGFEPFVRDYTEKLCITGAFIRFDENGRRARGRVEGVAADGALIVSRKGKRIALHSANISVD